jgi:spoIIIJ-associated protein
MGYRVNATEIREYPQHGFTLISATVDEIIPGKWFDDMISSVQHIVRCMTAREIGLSEHEVHSTIDINGNIARRIHETEIKAQMMASRAETFGVNVHMDPMNPLARKVVHGTLQNHPTVRTESEGFGINRHIVIYPQKV